MGKIATIHQPNYLPWIGLFSKAAQAEVFIIYDTAQYSSGGNINRTRIRTSTGSCYLTVPIGRNQHSLPILDVELSEYGWRESHLKAITQNYAKSQYLPDYLPFFEQMYRRGYRFLWELNEDALLFLFKAFGIEAEILKASRLDVDRSLRSTDMLIGLTRAAGADTYLSGPSGKGYLELDKFEACGMDVRFAGFEHPRYPQRFAGFEPNLSAIDLLLNTGGAAAGKIVRDAGWMEDGLPAYATSR